MLVRERFNLLFWMIWSILWRSDFPPGGGWVAVLKKHDDLDIILSAVPRPYIFSIIRSFGVPIDQQDDAFQDIMLQLIRGRVLRHYDPAHPSGSRLKTYVVTVIRHYLGGRMGQYADCRTVRMDSVVKPMIAVGQQPDAILGGR